MRSGILPLPRVGVCVIYCPRGASAESTCYPLHGRAQPAHRSTWGKGQCRSPMPGASSRFCSSLNATKANSHTPIEWRPYNATSWTPRCNACARLRPRNRGRKRHSVSCCNPAPARSSTELVPNARQSSNGNTFASKERIPGGVRPHPGIAGDGAARPWITPLV